MKGGYMNKRMMGMMLSLAMAVAAAALWLQPAAAQGSVPISLPDALAKKLVTVTLSSTGDIFFREGVGYSVRNISSGDLIVVLPAGLLLPPDDSSEQTLLVTLPVTLTLKANQVAGGKLWTVCTQLTKHAPGSTAQFTLGGVATGNLAAVANVIAQHNWNGDLGAQLAVWRITDNMTMEDVTGGSGSQTSDLLRTIAPLLALAGDPFTRAETILQESGTGLHFSQFGTPTPLQSPLPGNTNPADILAFLQRCMACCPCFGAFGGLFFLIFLRR
jgi:hypothetical protein